MSKRSRQFRAIFNIDGADYFTRDEREREYTPAPLDCPHCGYGNESHTPIGAPAVPHDGDFSLCVECGGWAVFETGAGLRKPTGDEADDIAQNRDCIRAELTLAAIRRTGGHA